MDSQVGREACGIHRRRQKIEWTPVPCRRGGPDSILSSMTHPLAAPDAGPPTPDSAMTLDFQYYFDTACDGMIVFDASRRVRTVNGAFARLVGQPIDSLAGKHFEELTEQSDRPAHSSPVQELATLGFVISMHRVRT